MMAAIWVVLIPMTPLPAAISPGELRTAERTEPLAGPGEHYRGLIACHLPDPLRRCWPCTMTWQARRRHTGGPASGKQSQPPAYAPQHALPALLHGSPTRRHTAR